MSSLCCDTTTSREQQKAKEVYLSIYFPVLRPYVKVKNEKMVDKMLGIYPACCCCLFLFLMSLLVTVKKKKSGQKQTNNKINTLSPFEDTWDLPHVLVYYYYYSFYL